MTICCCAAAWATSPCSCCWSRAAPSPSPTATPHTPSPPNVAGEDPAIRISDTLTYQHYVTVETDYKILRSPDPLMDKGTEEIIRKGIPGQIVETYEDTVVSGEVVSTKYIGASHDTSHAELVRYGTRVYEVEEGDATGTVATEGRTVAVDPNVIPYGTTIEVIYPDGSRARYVAEDCGGAIKGNIVDLWFPTKADCYSWGRRNVTVYILDKKAS